MLMTKYPVPEVATVVGSMPQTCNTENWKEGEFIIQSLTTNMELMDYVKTFGGCLTQISFPLEEETRED